MTLHKLVSMQLEAIATGGGPPAAPPPPPLAAPPPPPAAPAATWEDPTMVKQAAAALPELPPAATPARVYTPLARSTPSPPPSPPLTEEAPAPAHTPPPPPRLPTFSVAKEFDGAIVLITGATGFLGSVVLEHMLRCTRVATVYVLIRSRGTRSVKKRFKSLMSEDLFARVPPTARARAQPLAGDITTPGLGLAPADAAALRSVDVVINCAAALAPRVHVRTAVANNALSVGALIDVAAAAPRLRAFVHVSTAWVHPLAPGAPPLKLETLPPLPSAAGGDVYALLARLRSAPPAVAAAEAAEMRAEAGFLKNNYLFSKLLAEHVVASAVTARGLPATVVRPSYVGPAGCPPHAGYFHGAAGAMSLAALSVMDLDTALPGINVADLADSAIGIVPVDVVAGVVLAAAAATSARAAAPAPGAPYPIYNACTSGTPAHLTYGASRAIMEAVEGPVRTLLLKMMGRGGAPPPELTAHLEHLTELVSANGFDNFKKLAFDGTAMADLVARVKPGDADAELPLHFGEGDATWETCLVSSRKYAANLFKSR